MTAGRKRLGYLTSDLAVPFERELLTHALRTAARLGVELVATSGGPAGRSEAAEGSAYRAIRGAGLDGVLLCAHTVCVGMKHAEIARFAREFAPAKVVIVGVEVPGFRCHSVSNESGAAALTEHLIVTHGRRRFAVVRGPVRHEEADERLRGVTRALERHGIPLPAERILAGDFTNEAGAAAAERILELDPELTNTDAIVFANDLMAISALDVFARARVSVPSTLAIVGFDDIELSHLARTPLTTVRQPLAQQITGALEDLVLAVSGRDEAGVVEHRTRLILRRSCGCGLVSHDYVSSAPPSPRPGEDPRNLLAEYSSAIASELTTTLRESSLPRALSDDWASDLVQTFVSRILGGGQNFIEKIDASASALVQQDEALRPLREAVLLLRRQLLSVTGKSGAAADDLDDATAEALLTIGSVEALREAQRRRAFEAEAVELSSASAALSAARSLTELRAVAYGELERLGLATCVPVLLDQGAPRIPFCSVDGVRDAALPPAAATTLALGGEPSRPLLLVPMTAHRAATGYVLYDANPESFLLCTRLTLALGAALHSALLMERLELAYEQIAEQALRDPLTGLWNRRYLDDRLREEVARHGRSRAGLSVCVIDLDGFKQVNDRHGHDAGDRVLVSVAELLVKSVRTCDVVARLGGDEFVALLPGAGPEQAMTVAERIVRGLDRQDEHGLVAASVGVASAGEREADANVGGELLREADAALLEAKRRGKSRALHFASLDAPSAR